MGRNLVSMLAVAAAMPAAVLGLADAAGRRTAALAGAGPVRLVNLAPDTYFCRAIADVVIGDGASLSDLMRRSGTVRPYSGGRRSGSCPPGR